jgi:hypothetical protein
MKIYELVIVKAGILGEGHVSLNPQKIKEKFEKEQKDVDENYDDMNLNIITNSESEDIVVMDQVEYENIEEVLNEEIEKQF